MTDTIYLNSDEFVYSNDNPNNGEWIWDMWGVWVCGSYGVGCQCKEQIANGVNTA